MRRTAWQCLSAAVLTAAGLGLFHATGLNAAAPKPTLDSPVISCVISTPASITLQVCAGASGTPAGFSLQWMTLEEFTANGGWYASDDPRLCKASFSGNAADNRYALAPGACVEVEVGDFLFDNGSSTNCAEALHCDTTYVFHSFAHATSKLQKSDWTAELQCATAACPAGCYALSQGYWRTHTGNRVDPDGIAGNGDEYLDYSEWPDAIVDAGGLQIGSFFYTLDELNVILRLKANKGKLPQLAHQLIAVEFSVAAYGWAPGSEEQQDCLETAHAAIADACPDICPDKNFIFTGTLSYGGNLIDCLDTGYIQAYHCE